MTASALPPVTGNVSSDNASSWPLTPEGRPLTRAYADERLRQILRQPALFVPDLAELRVLCRVLGVRLKIRRVEFTEGGVSDYLIP